MSEFMRVTNAEDLAAGQGMEASVGRAGEGVLRQRLPEWLGEPEIRPVVSGFAQAHRMHGGAGAYYVFLKRAAR
jgi:DNA-nicking Smr family endonuclease